MDLRALTTAPFTYPQVGATADDTLPKGYHHIDAAHRIGTGRRRFGQAGEAVLRYGMQRGAGLKVSASSPIAAPGAVVVVHLGPIAAPSRIIYVVEEQNRRGFGYGTLSGHPESGEELFSVQYDPDRDVVHAVVRAFSRPATWWSKAGHPITSLAQRIVTRRYLRAV